MQMLIRHFDGSVRSAILLAVIGSRLRVALPGDEDAREYLWAGGEWRDESGISVVIEFEPAEEAVAQQCRFYSPAPPDTTHLAVSNTWEPIPTSNRLLYIN